MRRLFKKQVHWFAFPWILLLILVALPIILKSSYIPVASISEEDDVEVKGATVKAVHVSTPSEVKALYMTSCTAATPSRRSELVRLIDETELNSVVLDIKDATGMVSFVNEFEKPATTGGCVVSDMEEFIQSLHDRGVYVIGRISVFQDPSYTALHPELAVKNASGGVWKDYKGLSFIDVSARPYWDYIVAIAERSYEIGFDELNFDYIRYPSDGNMSDVRYSWSNASSTKPENLESFFSYLKESLSDTGAKTSADIFGMTTTVESDMNIGQVLERALPYFDYIYPMVYPSHYPAGWSGFANPAANPYEVIKISMSRGLERERAWQAAHGISTSSPSKLRPWLQDFDLGADYTPEMVRAQIQATYDAGLTGWLMWNAANNYTREALSTDTI